jgi:tripartite-type tricarboxylate transporter receptor subunit TctC
VRLLCRLGLLGLLLAIVFPAVADWPDRPVRVVVPFSPGGSVDIVARVVGQELGKALGHTIVVENRAGATGNIGMEAAAKSPPDGYTLLMASSPLAVNASLFRHLAFDPVKDFSPIALVALQPNVLMVNRSVPATTVGELIAYAKANPGILNFGSSGAGASQHLAGELFQRRAGIEMVHVPYKGGAPAMTALLAGDVQLVFEPIPSASQHLRSGQLRALAVTTLKRTTSLPDLPTIAEAGLPGYESRGWIGLVAPAGTPRGIVERLNQTVVSIVRSPEIAARLTEMGLEVTASSPAEFADFISQEIAASRELVTAAKITLD